MTRETQASICAWADETFGPPVSDASIAARALVEMAELVTACVNGEPAERIGEEIADVVIVLARLGRSVGVDVTPVRDMKWSPNGTAYGYAVGANDALAAVLMALEPGCENRTWAESSIAIVAVDLYNLAATLGIDLPSSIDAKMAVNRARRWKTDGRGHGQHIKETL